MIHPGRERFLVLSYDQLEAPLASHSISIFDHGGNFVTRVDVQEGEWNMPKKGLSGQPQQHSRILPHRPQHGQVAKMLIRFPENIDALVF
jgi:hypothetical protein